MKIFKRIILTITITAALYTLTYGQCSIDYLESTFTTQDFRVVYFLDANTGFIGGDNLSLLKTTDGGKSWAKVTVNGTPASTIGMKFLSISFGSPLVGLAVGSSVGFNTPVFYKTTDGGNTWTNIVSTSPGLYGPTDYYFAVEFKNATTAYAVGMYSTIKKTIDAGANWTTVDYANVSQAYLDIHFTSANSAYVSTTSGLQSSCGIAYTSTDFSPVPGLQASNFYSTKLMFVNATTGFSVGSLGTIKKTVNGTTWSTLISNVVKNLTGVYFTDVNHGIVVGNAGTILRTTDGATFTPITTGITKDLYSVWFTNATTGFIVGDAGIVLKTTDGGQTWNNINKTQLVLAPTIKSLSFPSSLAGYVGQGGYTTFPSQIAKTMDGGFNWTTTTVNSNDFSGINAMYFTDANTGVIVSYNNTSNDLGVNGGSCIYRTTTGGTGATPWIPVAHMGTLSGTPITINDVHFADANNGWAVGNYGSTYKTTDGGVTWSARITVPTNPNEQCMSVFMSSAGTAYTGGTAFYKMNNGTWTIPSVSPLQFINDICFISDNQGWICGPSTGGGGTSSVYSTTNGGASWTKINSAFLNGLLLNQIYFSDINNGYIATDRGVYKTSDAGANWTQVASGYMLRLNMAGSSFGYALGDELQRFSCATSCPKMFDFSPKSGGPGTMVTINGSGFTSANKVTFNNIDAVFTVVNDSQINATCPSGLATGTIIVYSPGSCVASMHNSTGFTSSFTYVSGIVVNGAGNANAISTNAGTLQMSAVVTPNNATDQTVTWFLSSGGAYATINASGLLTAVANGVVTVKATANDGSGVTGVKDITISNQPVLVTGITVTGAGNAAAINTAGGTLQMSATVAPANATNTTVTWSVISGTGSAVINTSGLLTAVGNGSVTVKATAKDGTNINGTLAITISGQPQTILVTSVTVSGANNAFGITVPGGTLQMNALVLPANATNPAVVWSITSGASFASISSSGVLKAMDNGTVTVQATANDGSGMSNTKDITITGQPIAITGITVTGANNATAISTAGGKLQMNAAVLPVNATTSAVVWSVTSITGSASINTTGLLTAIGNGIVTVTATATDGSMVYGTKDITISGQAQTILITSITVTGAGNATTIGTLGGTLQMNASVGPINASNASVIWSITAGSALATINQSGLLTALGDGVITVKATANDGSNVSGSKDITITGQSCIAPAKPTITVNFTTPETPVLISSAATGNQWFLNGTAINGATQATYNVTQVGTYAVQSKQGTCVSSLSDGTSIVVTGLEKALNSGLYPNPVSNELTFTTSGNGVVSIYILDVLGKPVKQFSYPNGGEVKIDVSDLPTGSYVLKASQQGQVQILHFIKK